MVPLPLVSLCTGGGRLDEAVVRALRPRRVLPVLYVEREAFAGAYLVGEMAEARMGEAAGWSDLERIPRRLLRAIRDLAPPAILTAGFPCQPWSTAGHRNGTADERWLWPHIRDAICSLGPGLVVLENVTDLARGGLGHVVGDLAAGGYRIAWTSLRASDVGAPHQRHRLFVVAVRELVHPNGQRWNPVSRWEPPRTFQPPDSGHDLANSHGQRFPRARPTPRQEPFIDGSDQDLADSDGGRLPSEWWTVGREDREDPRGNVFDRCHPSYPPAPNAEAWSRLPEWCWPSIGDPETALPALRSVAHGLVASERIDLLRLAGNGVVPDQAEAAVAHLLGEVGL